MKAPRLLSNACVVAATVALCSGCGGPSTNGDSHGHDLRPIKLGIVDAATSALPGGLIAVPSLFESVGARGQSFIYLNDLGTASNVLLSAFTAGLKKARGKLETIAEYPVNVAGFGPAIAAALTSRTWGVAAFNPGAATGPLVAAIGSADPSVKIAITASSWLPSVARYLGTNANGLYVVDFVKPATAQVPGITMFNSNMSQYAKAQTRNSLAFDAWTSVWDFEKMASRLKAISWSSVLRAFTHFSGLLLGGIYPPLTKSFEHPFTAIPGSTCGGLGGCV